MPQPRKLRKSMYHQFAKYRLRLITLIKFMAFCNKSGT